MHTNWESIFLNCVAENEMHLVWQYGLTREPELAEEWAFFSLFFLFSKQNISNNAHTQKQGICKFICVCFEGNMWLKKT